MRVELDGEVLAESSRPRLLLETYLPVRFYLPPEDLRVGSRPVAKKTICAYKREASYLEDLKGGPRDDLVWTYPAPPPEAGAVTDLVAFYDEKVDVIVDGQPRERPRTRHLKALMDETEGSGGEPESAGG